MQQAVGWLVVNSRDRYDDNLATFILHLPQHYPGDIGLFAPPFLNCLTFQLVETMCLPPGTLHVYVHGVAVEDMVTSDNVLRAGLAPQKVNLTEFIACVIFESVYAEQLSMRAISEAGKHDWRVFAMRLQRHE